MDGRCCQIVTIDKEARREESDGKVYLQNVLREWQASILEMQTNAECYFLGQS